MKDKVYRDRPNHPQDLENNIRREIQGISVVNLPEVYANMKSRLNFATSENGVRFENLMNLL